MEFGSGNCIKLLKSCKPVRWETHAYNSSNVKVCRFDCNTFIKDSAGLIHHRKEYHFHNFLFW